MNNVVLLAVFATIAFFVFPCDGESGSCPVPLKPTFLEGLANVMVSERFVFMSDFMKFCRAFERGMNTLGLFLLTSPTGAII